MPFVAQSVCTVLSHLLPLLSMKCNQGATKSSKHLLQASLTGSHTLNLVEVAPPKNTAKMAEYSTKDVETAGER